MKSYRLNRMMEKWMITTIDNVRKIGASFFTRNQLTQNGAPHYYETKRKKAKGNKHESRIANEIHHTLLTLNNDYKSLFEDLADDNLRPKRDYSSGNFKDSQGDVNLGLAKRFFPYSIECKDWKTLDLRLNALLKNNIKVLVDFWHEQAIPNSKKSGLFPLVVFKSNRTQDFCFYDKNEVKVIPIGRFIKIDNWIICLFGDFISEVSRRMAENERPFRDWNKKPIDKSE